MKKAKCPYGEHEIRLPDEIEIDDQVRCPIDFRDAIVVTLGPPIALSAIEGEPALDPDVDEPPPAQPPPAQPPTPKPRSSHH